MMTRAEKQKMLAGDLYDPDAPELQADVAAARALQRGLWHTDL
jgi:Maltose acetyltransferase